MVKIRPITRTPYGKRLGRPAPRRIPNVQNMLDDVKLICARELERITIDSEDGYHTMSNQKMMESISNLLIDISKEERASRKDEDFDKIDDDKLEELAKKSTAYLKKDKREPKETDESTANSATPTK